MSFESPPNDSQSARRSEFDRQLSEFVSEFGSIDTLTVYRNGESPEQVQRREAASRRIALLFDAARELGIENNFTNFFAKYGYPLKPHAEP